MLVRYLTISFLVLFASCSARQNAGELSQAGSSSTNWIPHGNAGQSCWAPDNVVNIPHCNDGFGCSSQTGFCAACGGNGQPCCDGPRTAFSGKCYYDPLNPHS